MHAYHRPKHSHKKNRIHAITNTHIYTHTNRLGFNEDEEGAPKKKGPNKSSSGPNKGGFGKAANAQAGTKQGGVPQMEEVLYIPSAHIGYVCMCVCWVCMYMSSIYVYKKSDGAIR